jgi:hypothetical protein
MPDISMCLGDGCPLKDGCYRFTAVPDMWQSYFTIPPHKDGQCADFVPPPKRITRREYIDNLVELFNVCATVKDPDDE